MVPFSRTCLLVLLLLLILPALVGCVTGRSCGVASLPPVVIRDSLVAHPLEGHSGAIRLALEGLTEPPRLRQIASEMGGLQMGWRLEEPEEGEAPVLRVESVLPPETLWMPSRVERVPYPVERVVEVPHHRSWWETTLLWIGGATLLGGIVRLGVRLARPSSL